MKQAIFNDIIQSLDELYPPRLAESWDRVGLHFGHPDKAIHKLMVTLDVRPEVAEEAIAKQVDTIVVHHPPIFSSIDRFDMRSPDIRMYARLLEKQINVYAMHTNFDVAWKGMNDHLAEAFGLENVESLGGLTAEGDPKLGRIGHLPSPLSRDEIIDRVKRRLGAERVTYIEKEAKDSYRKVAIVGGSGSSVLPEVIEAGAEVFITGDITYHKGHDAYETPLLTIDAGHYIEHIFIEKVVDLLEDLSQENQWGLEIIASETKTNPFNYQ